MGVALPDSTTRTRFQRPAAKPPAEAPPFHDVSRPSLAERRHARASVIYTFLPSAIVLALAVWALWQAAHSAK